MAYYRQDITLIKHQNDSAALRFSIDLMTCVESPAADVAVTDDLLIFTACEMRPLSLSASEENLKTKGQFQKGLYWSVRL